MMNQKTYRGFASMDADKRREIARKGGRTAHDKGRAHEFTSEEGKIAGRKGGRAVSRNREHMANIGRLGALARKWAETKTGTASLSDNVQNPELESIQIVSADIPLSIDDK